MKTCRGKLTEHYKRTATVPTSVWSKKCPVNIHQIYTRLSWVKEEQTPAGSSQSELTHYTDVFNENEEGLVPNRILVQGQTGIGKSTFVKKLALDWAELNDKRTVDKQQDVKVRCEVDGSVSQNCEDSSREDYVDVSENETKALKRFELVLVVNLKEVSKCQSLKDVICGCNLFPEEDTAMTEQLLSYITKNQEKVLLVFDGYDEYRCGINSEIYEIFRGKKLRNCCVLITTRISKADDLREFKDVHSEITGFSEEDSEVFASRIVGSKTEAMELMDHLFEKKLTDLAKVPLLVLFFCTLWKKGKLESFPETKSKLYYMIVQYVLDHNQGKRSPGHFGKVEDYKEILAEIGKVALECLLKDDHVFELDQLSTSILCEESGFIGLLQVSEYTENLRPAGMVSFIHKSIQEFLAAWYTTYRCVPEGDLGEIKEHARTLEDFRVLENVFQFICGLSDNGAVKVFEHLASVRISNPGLDLSKTTLDVTSEMYIPLSHTTYAQEKFSELVYNCFQEVQSKPQLLNHCFDCTGGVVLVTRQLTELLKNTKVKNVTEFIRSDVVFPVLNNNKATYRILYELVDILKCLHIPLRITETESFTLGDFLMNLQKYWSSCHCRFTSILCFRNDQFQFYVTSLKLCCDNISRLFTGATAFSVQSGPTEWCLEQFCYKFLRSLQCGALVNSSILKALGVVIRNCKYLTSITIEKAECCFCDILESVPNPSKCTLKIGDRFGPQCTLQPSEVEKLATLLPRFTNILHLNLSLSFSCSETFVASVTQETLEELVLDEISLTPAAAAMLGRSLPGMSSLKNLTLSGGIFDDRVLQTKALFGGFNEALPLRQLCFSDFSIRDCLASLSNSLRFFFNLHYLKLTNINWNEHNLLHLLKSLEFIPNLETLMVVGERQSHSESCLESCSEEVDIQTSFTHNTLRTLEMRQISLTPPAAAALGRLLPEMSALERLVLTRRDGSTLQALEMGALFGGFNKTLPLQHLTFTGFSVRDCLSPLAESFRFFPNLQKPYLDIDFFIDGNNFPGFLESLRFIPCLRALIVNCKAMTRAGCTEEEQTASSLKTGCTPVSESNLYLDEISLTPVAAAALGRSISEMSSLEELILTGEDGNILQGVDMEALFGQFHKALPLRTLALRNITLTRAAAAALGRQLPEMSSLQRLEITGVDGSILQGEEMEALFGGFNKTLPLQRFTFTGFSIRGCLAPLSKSLRFFPNLQELSIDGVNMDEHNFFHLFWGVKLVPNLETLIVKSKPQSHSNFCSEEVDTEIRFTHENLRTLDLCGMGLTPAAAAALGRLLREMSSLQVLLLTDSTLLQAAEMDALFGGFNKPLPLVRVIFSGFSVSCLAPLAKSFRYFPDLVLIDLDIDCNNNALCGFLESDLFLPRIIPRLRILIVECKGLTHGGCTEEVNTMGHLTLTDFDSLELRKIRLTPAVATVLGQALSKMSSLQYLVLVSLDGTVLQGEEVEALFGGFDNTLPLQNLTFSGFNVRGCLAPLVKSFRFFPNLQSVAFKVAFSTEDQQNVCGLLDTLTFFPNVNTLSVQCEALTCPGCTDELNTVDRLTKISFPREITLSGINLAPAAAAALGRSVAGMSSLRTLKLTGKDGSILNAEEMEALFGGFNTTLPLRMLDFSGFNVRGCLAPLTNSLQFLPSLQHLTLTMLNLDEHDLYGLLKSFVFVSDLRKLDLSHNPLGHAVTSIVPHVINGLSRLLVVNLRQTASEEDLKCLQERVKQARPRLDVCID